MDQEYVSRDIFDKKVSSLGKGDLSDLLCYFDWSPDYIYDVLNSVNFVSFYDHLVEKAKQDEKAKNRYCYYLKNHDIDFCPDWNVTKPEELSWEFFVHVVSGYHLSQSDNADMELRIYMIDKGVDPQVRECIMQMEGMVTRLQQLYVLLNNKPKQSERK